MYSALLQPDSQVPCVTDPGSSTAGGTAVQLWICTEDTSQNWTMESDGTVQINGLCLDTAGAATSNGTAVVLNSCSGSSSQVWQPGPNDTLVNKAAGACLEDTSSNTSNGAPLQIGSCTGGLNQQWRLPAV